MAKQLGPPASRLPTELLSEILALHCATTYYRPPLDTDGRYSPLFVCRKWLQTVLSYPHCWTTLSIIWIVTSESLGHNTRAAVKELLFWIRRHKELLARRGIDFSIQLHFDDATAIRKFHKHSVWKRITDSLREILSDFTSYSEDLFYHLYTTLESGFSSNRLTRLRLVRVPEGKTPNSIQLPALRYLYIDCNITDHELALFQCISLWSLCLPVKIMIEDDMNDMTTILLPFSKLKKLSITEIALNQNLFSNNFVVLKNSQLVVTSSTKILTRMTSSSKKIRHNGDYPYWYSRCSWRHFQT